MEKMVVTKVHTWHGRGLDRLPDSVVEDILSRLPITDAVQTSLLSRRWRHRWESTPRLAFDKASFPRRSLEYIRDHKRRLVKAVDRVLLLHAGPIHEFKLSLEFEDYPDASVWLRVLSRKDVRGIVLKCCSGFPGVPSSLFECELLRRLELHGGALRVPVAFGGFRCLVALHLQFAVISEDDLNRLLSRCTLLEELQLENVEHNRLGISICAPKLLKLRVVGYLRYLHLENTPALASASVEQFSAVPVSVAFGQHSLAKLCSAIPRIENLVLKGHFFPLLSAGNIPEQPLRAPDRLKSLTMDVNLEDSKECKATHCFLGSCRSLEILKIHHRLSEPAGTGIEEAELFWESKNGLNEKFDQLICMEVTGVSGLGPQMAFLRFMMASAPNLDRLNIGLDEKVTKSVSRFKTVAKGLLSCPRASTQARIILLE